MDYNELTLDSLKACTIKILREKAKELQVKSPTNKTKDELIVLIIEKKEELIRKGVEENKATEVEKPIDKPIRKRKEKEEEEKPTGKPLITPIPPKVFILDGVLGTPNIGFFSDSFGAGSKDGEPQEVEILNPVSPEEQAKSLSPMYAGRLLQQTGGQQNSPQPRRDSRYANQNQGTVTSATPYSRNRQNPYGGVNRNPRDVRQNETPPQQPDGSEAAFRPQQSVKEPEAFEIRSGILEILADGYGFIRAKNYESGEGDAHIAIQKIKRAGLRKGDFIVAETRKQAENRPSSVVNILEINGVKTDSLFVRPNFDNLTPIYPNERYKLEIPNMKNDYAIRSIDLVAPIGKGQRAMLVSPPKAGKTTLLKKIAASLSFNYPQAKLIVLLVDERPEEVTDMQRSIKGEVVYSTFDEMPEHHTKAAELVLERAKRLVEMGEDVVILMDSLTRLARAYNLVIAPTGRTLSGGIDPGALHNPKRFFGAARNIENGGSLTIIATALIDTGSRMDDVIYEEFKGTGNMEIHLDRRLSEKRIFPAIDLNRSGTRREELLLDQTELEGVWGMRKMLSSGDITESTEALINDLVKTNNNKEFIDQLLIKIKTYQKMGYVKP